MTTTGCMHLPLVTQDYVQVAMDYTIPAVAVWYLTTAAGKHAAARHRILRCALQGALVFAPIEYVQPRIGWVYYRKCALQRLAPMGLIWMVHALWDGLILTGLLVLVWTLIGLGAFKARSGCALFIVAAGGMAQELFLETHQCLWYYPPNRWNPVWAVIGGHPMTLQQWHWAVIPPLFYMWRVPAPASRSPA